MANKTIRNQILQYIIKQLTRFYTLSGIFSVLYLSVLCLNPYNALFAQNIINDNSNAIANTHFSENNNAIDTADLSLRPFRYTVVSDSSVIPDSLNTPLVLPYPLYRSFFNQARIRHTTAMDGNLNTADSLLLESILQDTLLQRIDRQIEYDIQIPHPRPASDLPIFSLLFGALTLFAYTRHRHEGYINPAIQAFYNVNLSRQFYDDFGFSNSTASFLLSLNTIFVLGSLVFLTIKNLSIAVALPDMLLLGVCVAAIALLFIAKRIALLFLANIALPTQEVIYFYLFNRDIIINTTAIVLLPLPIIAAFAKPDIAQWAWLVALVIVCLSFVYSYYRGFLIVKDFVWYHKFHFLLYLCAFEIAPLLIIIKLLG